MLRAKAITGITLGKVRVATPDQSMHIITLYGSGKMRVHRFKLPNKLNALGSLLHYFATIFVCCAVAVRWCRQVGQGGTPPPIGGCLNRTIPCDTSRRHFSLAQRFFSPQDTWTLRQQFGIMQSRCLLTAQNNSLRHLSDTFFSPSLTPQTLTHCDTHLKRVAFSLRDTIGGDTSRRHFFLPVSHPPGARDSILPGTSIATAICNN